MFNLTETFKEGYEAFLTEQAEQDFERAIESLEESQKQAERSFEIVREYFDLYAASEGLLEAEAGFRDATSSAEQRKEEKVIDKDQSLGSNVVKDLMGFLAQGSGASYKPQVGTVEVKKISEMKFPQNIIFFLQALIEWLVNLVKKFLSAITNGIQRLFGVPTAEDFKGSLRLNLEKAKTIENFVLPIANSITGAPKAAKMVQVDPSNLEQVKKVYSLQENVLTEDEVETQNKPTMAIQINIQKDMEDLNQSLVYFLDMFDNSYGSNQEKLFETEDLQLLLELFRNSIEMISKGESRSYALQGQLTELDVVNKEKLKDNLIRTKINTENLKKVYVETQKRILSILQVIGHKQLLAVGGMGVSFKFYTAATYNEMIKILDALEPRIKDANKLEKRLKKMSDTFNKVVIQLGKQRKSIANYGEVVYMPIYQKRINDLFDSARYVSQTITLRMATLSLYIKQLKEVRENISNLNSINSSGKSIADRLGRKRRMF